MPATFAVKRLDRAPLGGATKTPEGFLITPVTITRSGVFEYMDSQGNPYREARESAQVFAPASLATLPFKPMVNEHPPEMVSPENSRSYMVGVLGEKIERDGHLMNGKAVWHDARSIGEIERGEKDELSAGYDTTLVKEPGIFDEPGHPDHGKPFDARQTEIRYNHVALCKRGRAGEEVRVRLDSLELELEPETKTTSKETKMAKIRIGDADYEVSQECADAFTGTEKVRKDSDKAVLTAAKSLAKAASAARRDKKSKDKDAEEEETEEEDRKDSIGVTFSDAELHPEAHADALAVIGKATSVLSAVVAHRDAALDKLDSAFTPASMATRVTARTSIMDTAKRLLPKEQHEKLDSMSNMQIRRAVVANADPEAKLDSLSNERICGRFDSLSATKETTTETRTDAAVELGTVLHQVRQDATGTEATEAQKRKDSLSNAWKNPVGTAVAKK